MHSRYDWLSLAIFVGLSLLFLHRSLDEARQGDHPIKYIPAAFGCIATDFVGNAEQSFLAWLIAAVTVGYIVWVLKPLEFFR